MQKITDLRGIKDTAKVFLHMNIEETKFSPLVIKHPFTDSQQNGDETVFEECCQAITAQIEALEMNQIKSANRDEKCRKMEDIGSFLNKTNCVLTEYDDKLVRQLIQNINVVNTREIEVVFKSGIIIEEMIP